MVGLLRDPIKMNFVDTTNRYIITIKIKIQALPKTSVHNASVIIHVALNISKSFTNVMLNLEGVLSRNISEN